MCISSVHSLLNSHGIQVGDGTNFVIILAGALLSEAEDLIRMGLKPTEIADGYEMALEKALSVLETLSCAEIKVSL